MSGRDPKADGGNPPLVTGPVPGNPVCSREPGPGARDRLPPSAFGGFTFSVETLGCKANLTDAHVLSARLQALGGRAVDPTAENSEAPEVFVLNSCTVTDRADRDALAILKKKSAKLRVLTGCLAEVDPQAIEKIAGEGRVLLARNSGKAELADAIVRAMQSIPAGGRDVWTGDRSAWHKKVDFLPGAEASAGTRTRAFLKVQDGCNQFCAYCIIPHARGRSRSVGGDAIVREVAELVNTGTNEVVLTAIHAADYDDKGSGFTELVRRVLEETRVPRLRLTSLDPAEISSELLELMANEPRLCAHLHVSLQSASTPVLLAMRRGYDAARAEACLNEIHARVPHAFVGMDMIAGFPGETDEQHRETMALLARTPWTRLHVFPFSERRMTEASRMVAAGLGVPETVKRERARELRELSAARLGSELSARVGKLCEVLTEEKPVVINGEPFTPGHSRSYFKVLVPGAHAPNQRIRARLTNVVMEREALVGTLV